MYTLNSLFFKRIKSEIPILTLYTQGYENFELTEQPNTCETDYTDTIER